MTICEALELVPDVEVENQMQHASDNAVARRAKKASFLQIYIEYVMLCYA